MEMAKEYVTPTTILSSKRRFGLMNDFDLVEELYWGLENHQRLPDEGEMLDQDRDLIRDIRRYGWFWKMAVANAKNELEIIEKAKRK